jgi:large subunit ribosomal protein L13
MSTNVLSTRDIKRETVTFDAKNKILGRLASEVAQVLIGKNKPNYVPYLDNGDKVIIVNAADVKVTGKKELLKKYVRHSGYPGGYREQNLAEMRAEKPEEVVRHAVKGMLPKNKLGREMIKKLTIYAGSKANIKQVVQKEEN